MPHSPRWYRGKLWLLNSGTGELGYIAGDKFQPITFCPGFVRGLAFWDNLALVGMSKLRTKAFNGLTLETRLEVEGHRAQCGLMIVDLTTGNIVHSLHIDGVVEELFDVVVLPGVRHPKAIGFHSEDIDRLVTFPGSGGIVTTKPTVKRPSIGATAQIAGLPRPSQVFNAAEFQIKYQQVYHLNPENLAPYDALTFPSLQKRWQTKPQLGELLGVSASVAGEMVGFAIAELLPDNSAEILSLLVLPAYRHQGIGTRLVHRIQQGLRQQQCNLVYVNYKATMLTAKALEPMLQRLGWQPPQSEFLLAQTTTDSISQAPWLDKCPLSEGFAVFPWQELTKTDLLHLQQIDYPPALSPLGNAERMEPLNSLGLRYHDRLIGWMVTHRVAADTIRYSTLFVSEPFRPKARGIALISAALKRQIASPVPNYTFAVAQENAAMLRFVRRHLQPYLTGISESRRAVLYIS